MANSKPLVPATGGTTTSRRKVQEWRVFPGYNGIRRHLVAFASTPQGLQQCLDDLAAFPTPRGLTINTRKSLTLFLQPSGREKKCKIITTRLFYINGKPLPVINVASVWRYLGISFTPDGTKSNGPQQHLLVLRTYLLPRLFHRLVLCPWSTGLLKKLYTQVRSSLRTWLALPHDVLLLPCPRGGGRTGSGFAESIDPVNAPSPPGQPRFSDHPGCAVALECPLLVGLRRRALDACHYQGVELRDKKAAHKTWAVRLHRSCKGGALRDSRRVPAAHQWISEGSCLLRGRQFIHLVKFRINAQPTLERTGRGRRQDVNCHAGCRALESLGHVLESCHWVHRNRTKRHDNVVRYMSGRLKPHYILPEGILKPDLAAYEQEDSLVIDAQVIGTKMSLGFLHHQKKEKYSGAELRRLIQGRNYHPQLVASATQTPMAGPPPRRLPPRLPTNFRGVWSSKSASDLLSLGLTKNDLKLLSVRCLQGGMRCSWAHRSMATAV
ncbi:hypothetical protein HPB47_015052 [Ixodes persulcatus]|uniref:Uncharacterized protein n=1 Tax=Ixodes persulcatus TaxID=34615 RepID=A0AC60QY14_IXOPE|nr:hypothetical protein HPB47_015052 [Ixodes persulcatus]